VAWTLSDGTLELAVGDGGGPTQPRTGRPPSVSSLGGRGLGIVDHLSRRWGVRSDDQGTTVWAVLTARPGGSRSLRSPRPGYELTEVSGGATCARTRRPPG
jgi:hypothetical protein